MAQLMEKSFEERIVQTQETIKQVIAQSGLNVAVLELILRDIHHEVEQLAFQNLQNRIKESEEKHRQVMMDLGEKLKDSTKESQDGDNTDI